VSKSQANIELAKYQVRDKIVDAKTSFKVIYDRYDIKYKSDIGKTIKERTYKRFLDNKKHLSYFTPFNISEIEFKHIENFKDELLKKGLQHRGINIILKDLSLIYKFCLQNNIVSKAPYIQKFPQKKVDSVDRLSMDQVQVALAESRKLKKAAKNLEFYILSMLHTGMRPQELYNLTWESFNFDSNFIRIISDNNLKKGRQIPLTDQTRSLFLERREESPQKVSPYTQNGINSALQKLSRKVGFKIYPYILRKTFGSMMADAGVSIVKLAEIMGNSVATCQKYYIHLSHESMLDDMQKNPLTVPVYL